MSHGTSGDKRDTAATLGQARMGCMSPHTQTSLILVLGNCSCSALMPFLWLFGWHLTPQSLLLLYSHLHRSVGQDRCWPATSSVRMMVVYIYLIYMHIIHSPSTGWQQAWRNYSGGRATPVVVCWGFDFFQFSVMFNCFAAVVLPSWQI